jgi:hypothetical protein
MAELTILDAMEDPELFGAWFAEPSWDAWRAFLAAVFGLPMSEAHQACYRAHTGRSVPPTTPAREVYVPVGRRGGKDRIASLVAVYLACFRQYRLAPGEKAVVMLLAADRRQAKISLRYITALIDGVPMLRALVERRTQEALHLSNGITIEIHSGSFKTTRGYTIVCFIGSEIAFWPTDTSANPDSEILNAVRPALATVPGALMLCISSPYARRGELWEAYRKHYGRDGDPVLVWQSDTASMNPTVNAHVIAASYEADEASAAAEWGGEFRRDVETFVSKEAIEAAVVPGRREVPPVSGVAYGAFVDPSGGSQDSMTLAIAHSEVRDKRVVAVLDCVREVKPPFSPTSVVDEFTVVLRAYGVKAVSGDRYAGEWPREQFRARGIAYDLAESTKSDLYRDLLPLLNSGSLELLDVPRLLAQLGNLERRVARGGKDSIDHPALRGSHDDLINAATGACLLAVSSRTHAVTPAAALAWAESGSGLYRRSDWRIE